MKVKSFLPFYLFTFLLFCACSSIDCPVQNTVECRYSIYDALGAQDTLKDTLYIWTQRADGKDTLLLNRGINLTHFALPVSYQQPEDMLVLYITDKDHERQTLDTIWLKKNDTPHFESVDCSAHYFHELTDVHSSHHRIDTVSIIHDVVDYDQLSTHMDIRFK